MARVLACFLASVVWLATAPAPRVDAAIVLRDGCRGPGNSVARADALLRNRYQLGSHPVVTLPAHPAWNENPLHSKNWEFNYHSLRFLLDLTSAWAETGDDRYLDRAVFLARDWQADNPRSAPRDPMAWNDHSTAWRATVYECLAEIVGRHAWLTTTLVRHGTALADPGFYRWQGNHALNQNIGLLDVGHYLRRSDWTTLARRRLTSLVQQSVDASGATNEQAVSYELYNYRRYTYARTRFAECGLPLGAAFDPVDRMPAFLAQATQPDGNYVHLGDTATSHATVIPGTPAEFAATRGASGPKPASTSRFYGAGYAFVRTGWGETRPIADEVFLSVRFGPAPLFHGHADGSAITLYGYGAPVVLDSGMYTIEQGPYRRYFSGRSAHNLVTVDGATPREGARTAVRWRRSSATMLELAMTGQPYAGVTAERRVTFSRSLGYVVVDDRLSATSTRTFRQLWHLRHDAAPTTSGARTWTRSPLANVMIVRITPARTRFVRGRTSPIQGWVSYRSGTRLAAPVLESWRSGTRARFLTLLVPYGTTQPSVKVSNVTLTTTGYALTVTVGGTSERIVAGATSSRIGAP